MCENKKNTDHGKGMSGQEDPVYTNQDINRELERAVSALEEAIFIARYVPTGEMNIADYEINDILNDLQELTNRSEGIEDDE